MYLIKHEVMMYEGMEVLVYLHVFLTSPVDGDTRYTLLRRREK